MKFYVYLITLILSLSLMDYSFSNPVGLTVQEGVIYREGKPIQTIGVNYFDGFHRAIKDPNDKSYEKGFAELNHYQIKFVRFAITPWWAYEFKLYFDDPAEFYRRLDLFVKSAEENNIGLIPSFFWKYAAAPDMMREPNQAWGDPDSKTTAFVKKITTEIVMRYRNSPAIWAWEFANEMDLQVDLPKANRSSMGEIFNPKNKLSWWCPPIRTEKDALRTADILHGMKVFSETVRSLDPLRMLSTGNAVPRAGSWHLYHHGKWGKNTRENFLEMLRIQNPEPYAIS